MNAEDLQRDELLDRLRNASTEVERGWIVTEAVLSSLPEDLKEATWAAAVPHWFDVRVLAALLSRPVAECNALYEGLRSLPFVEANIVNNGHMVHTLTREAILNYLWNHRRKDYQEFSARAADYFSYRDEPEWQIERVYHLLISAPHEAAKTLRQLGFKWYQTSQYNLMADLEQKRLEHDRAGRSHALHPMWVSFLLEEVPKKWYAVLRAWPQLSLWQDIRSFVDADVDKGLRFLGLQDNPFGTERAEGDTLLLQYPWGPDWLWNLREARSTVVTGATGAGKTAAALHLTFYALRDHDLFPLYYPVEPKAISLQLQMDELATVLSGTLLRYLAVTPGEFVNREREGRTTIVELFDRYIGSGDILKLRLHEAGLTPLGDGIKMLQELERLARAKPMRAQTIDGLLALASRAYPAMFQGIVILLDVQETSKSIDRGQFDSLRSLFDLVERLVQTGVVVKIFLSDTYQAALLKLCVQLPLWPERLKWSDDDLMNLLKRRLALVGDDSLTTWCNPEAAVESPNERLAYAAQGMPGRLIRTGNDLLKRIGQKQDYLTVEDLDEILGPLRESTRG